MRTIAAEFLDAYPGFFTTDAERRNFLNGVDESPATRLYGEIPSTFPTIRNQVSIVSSTVGKSIRVAFVDGGINDLGPEDVMDPRLEPGHFIEEWDGLIKDIAYERVFSLLRQVRSKCPKAVVMYFGFFAPLSRASNHSAIRELLKHEYDDDFKWWFNEHIYEAVDVDQMIHEAKVRGGWLQGRWQYWTRRAVVDANRDDDVRGPGVIFVPSAMGLENAAFGRDPWLWQDYTDPTGDPARNDRGTRIPRVRQYGALRNLFFLMLLGQQTNQQMTDLRNAIDGPASLQSALQLAVSDGLSSTRRKFILSAISAELHSIQHALIASCAHPNTQGARQYADVAIARFQAHQAMRQRILRERLRPNTGAVLGTGGETVEQTLTRYNLRSGDDLEADATHFDVDSITVRTETAPDSDENLWPDMWLVVTTRTSAGRQVRRNYLLNFEYRDISSAFGDIFVTKLYPHFEPTESDRFTIDAGGLSLTEIISTHVVMGQDIPNAVGHGTSWRPERIRLEFNGVQVADVIPVNTRLTPGGSLDLQYPTPAPNFRPPQIRASRTATARSFRPGANPAAEAVVRPRARR